MMNKYISSLLIAAVTLLFSLFLAAGPLSAADQPQDSQMNQSRTGLEQGAQSQQMGPGQAAADTSFFRASQILDKSLKNNQNEDLGQVRDVVVGSNGEVQYLIVAHGGILGFGTDLTPVPWEAASVQVRQNEVVASLSKDKLDNAPKFSGEEWPNFAQGDYSQEVQTYYGKDTGGGQGTMSEEGEEGAGIGTPGRPESPEETLEQPQQ